MLYFLSFFILHILVAVVKGLKRETQENLSIKMYYSLQAAHPMQIMQCTAAHYIKECLAYNILLTVYVKLLQTGKKRLENKIEQRHGVNDKRGEPGARLDSPYSGKQVWKWGVPWGCFASIRFREAVLSPSRHSLLSFRVPLSVSVLWGSHLASATAHSHRSDHLQMLQPGHFTSLTSQTSYPQYVLIQTKTKRMVQGECRVSYSKWGQGPVVAKWPVLCVCRVETGEGGGRLLSLVYSWGVQWAGKCLLSLLRHGAWADHYHCCTLTQSWHSELFLNDFYHISNWNNALPHMLKWVHDTSI